jgi:hypothetical protein
MLDEIPTTAGPPVQINHFFRPKQGDIQDGIDRREIHPGLKGCPGDGLL